MIAKLGVFNGIAQGVLLPATPTFRKDGRTLYVSNLTLYLPCAGVNPAIDSDWTLQNKGYTASQIFAFIFGGLKANQGINFCRCVTDDPAVPTRQGRVDKH